MKKFASALAAAAVFGAPAIASAQTEIRPYLTADVSVSYITNYSDVDTVTVNDLFGVGPTTPVIRGVENDFQYNDSNVASSVFGLRASHDLGNGLKAIGNLEGDFNTATGAFNAAGMFRRAANVGLEGAFGRLEFGTKMNPLVAFHGGSGYALGGNSVSTNVAASMGFANFFTQKSITYSAQAAGLTTQLQYGFEDANPGPFGSAREQMYSGFARYDIAGFAIGAAAQHIKGASNSEIVPNTTAIGGPSGVGGTAGPSLLDPFVRDSDVTTWIVGAGYTFAGWTVRGFWVNNDDVKPAGVNWDNSAWHVGLKYAVTPQLEVGGSYTLHDSDSWLANLQARYAMSKNVVLYGLVNHVDNDENGATFGLLWNNGNDRGQQLALLAGESETAVSVGMIVSF